MEDRETATLRWAERTGLMMRHPDLRPEEILKRYGRVCVAQTNPNRWSVVAARPQDVVQSPQNDPCSSRPF